MRPMVRDREVVVGRDAPSDVVVRDGTRALSRQHARFTLRGSKLVVEDLSSVNGTVVGGKQIERAVVAPGTPVELGSVRCVLHVRGSHSRPVAGVESHDAFAKLLRHELARARFFNEEAALVMIQLRRDVPVHVGDWHKDVLDEFRDVDRFGLYSPSILEVALPRWRERTASNGPQRGNATSRMDGLYKPNRSTSRNSSRTSLCQSPT